MARSTVLAELIHGVAVRAARGLEQRGPERRRLFFWEHNDHERRVAPPNAPGLVALMNSRTHSERAQVEHW